MALCLGVFTQLLGGCAPIGASNVTLDLNGYSMTGQGDPSGCSGTSTANEYGILVALQRNVVIRGLGIVQQFRNPAFASTTALAAP